MKIQYLLTPLLVFLTALAGGLITGQGMAWYQTINLPGFTPAGWIIGLVWTILFILTIIAALIVYSRNKKTLVFTLFLIINLGLNVMWSQFFFGWHFLFESVIEAGFLAVSVLLLIIFALPKAKLAAALFLPYFLWVCFATFLTYNVWLLNR